MGVYLPKPHTEKISEDGGCQSTSPTYYGVSSMQGWRQSMEDAHISIPSVKLEGFLDPLSVYGVFDGHGGSAVSLWVADRFEGVFSRVLMALKKKKNFEETIEFNSALELSVVEICEALRQTYLTLDRMMDTAAEREELKKIYEEEERKRNLTNSSMHDACSSRSGEVPLDPFFIELSNQRQCAQLLENNGEHIDNDNGTSFSHETPLDASSETPNNEKETTVFAKPPEESTSDTLSTYRTSLPDAVKDDISEKLAPSSSTKGESTLEKLDSTNILTGRDDKNDLLTTSNADTQPALSTVTPDSFLTDKQEVSATLENGYDDVEYDNAYSNEYRSLPYQPEGCGCTAIVVVCIGGKNPVLITANAGDSRAVLCRDGCAIPLSYDHKPSLPRETKRIYDAGGTVSFGRVEGNLNLSRALGDLCYKEDPSLPPEAQKISGLPDVSIVRLCQRDQFVIIACDGIWDCLSNQDAVDFVSSRLHSRKGEKQLSKICEEICDHCLSQNPLDNGNGMGCDNMTIIIVVFSNGLIASGKASYSTQPEKCVLHYEDTSSIDEDDADTSLDGNDADHDASPSATSFLHMSDSPDATILRRN